MNFYKTGETNRQLPQPPPPKRMESCLSKEILEMIFSYLKQPDIDAAARVNKLWRVAVIDTERHRMISFLNSFSQFVCTHLDEKASKKTKAKFDKAIEDISTIENLVEIWETRSTLEDKIPILLQRLWVNQINHLKSKANTENKPLSYQKIFILKGLYFGTLWMSNDPRIYGDKAVFILMRQVHRLVDVDKFEKVKEIINRAIKMAANKRTDTAQQACLNEMIFSLENNLKKASEFPKKYSLFFARKLNEVLDKSSNPMHTILIPLRGDDDSLCFFAVAFANIGRIKTAIKVANTIQNDSKKADVLDIISEKVNIKRAVKIHDPVKKDRFFRFLSSVLSEKGSVAAVVKIANELDDQEDRRLLFSHFSEMMLKRDYIETAKECVNAINDVEDRRYLIRDFSEMLMDYGYIEQTLEFANELTDEIDQGRVFKQFSKHLIKKIYIYTEKELREFANQIHDKFWKELVLNDINKSLLEVDKIKKAIELKLVKMDDKKIAIDNAIRCACRVQNVPAREVAMKSILEFIIKELEQGQPIEKKYKLFLEDLKEKMIERQI